MITIIYSHYPLISLIIILHHCSNVKDGYLDKIFTLLGLIYKGIRFYLVFTLYFYVNLFNNIFIGFITIGVHLYPFYLINFLANYYLSLVPFFKYIGFFITS